MQEPIICFGQQPCGFFPKRFLVAKINTAKNLQKQIGGKIIFFYHDSDADFRETITVLNDIKTGAEVRLNFVQENKIQKNFSPLYLKRIPASWQAEILKQLPRFVSPQPSLSLEGRGIKGEGANPISIFQSVNATNVADFCLEMYQKLGLLDGIEVVRSSDKTFRNNAADLTENFYADVLYENEIVRARILPSPAPSINPTPLLSSIASAKEGALSLKLAELHHGGDKFTQFSVNDKIEKSQITPGRDQRFAWMNSVINSTHYITGNAEYEYLKREDFPEVNFIKRDQIENQELAYLPNL